MALMSGHINMKQRLEVGLNGWDKASRDEKPRGTGGIQRGRQQEQPLVPGSRFTSIPAPIVIPALGSNETLQNSFQ